MKKLFAVLLLCSLMLVSCAGEGKAQSFSLMENAKITLTQDKSNNRVIVKIEPGDGNIKLISLSCDNGKLEAKGEIESSSDNSFTAKSLEEAYFTPKEGADTAKLTASFLNDKMEIVRMAEISGTKEKDNFVFEKTGDISMLEDNTQGEVKVYP